MRRRTETLGVFVAAGLASGVAGAGAALADDFPIPALTGAAPAPVVAPAPYSFWPFEELRLGVFAHNVIHDESAPVDVSIEVLSSTLSFPGYDSPAIATKPEVNWSFHHRPILRGSSHPLGK